MPASVSGSKTCTVSPAPHLSAATLTALLAIAPENMTVAQFIQLSDALSRVSGGFAPTATLGSILA